MTRTLASLLCCLTFLAARAAADDARPLSSAELVKMSESVQKEVEKLRGWKFKHPVKTEVYSEEQLRKFIERKLFEEELGKGRLERLQAFLRMTRLIPADVDVRETMMRVLLNQIGGFYDPDTKAFYMLARAGVDYGPLLNRTLVAHELCHALDDQYVDLDKLMKSREQTEDWGLAVGSVVEGSATVLMTHYMGQAQASGDFDAAEIGRVMQAEMERSRVFAEAPPYFTALMATYIGGMHFLIAGDVTALADAGAGPRVGERVLKCAEAPPTSSEQILHPEKYWDPKLRDDPVHIDDARVEKVLTQDGLKIAHRNTTGELMCAILTSDERRELDMMAASIPSFWTNDGASGWGGDRFFLLSPSADESKGALEGLKGVWITLWDTPSDRDEFISDYATERPDTARVARKWGGRGAVFFYGFDEHAADKRMADLAPVAASLTKAGKPWSID